MEWVDNKIVRISIRASVYGPMCIHSPVGNDRGGFVVSHVGTGFCAGRFYTREDAVKYAEAIANHSEWETVHANADGIVTVMSEDLIQHCKDKMAEIGGLAS